MSVTFDDGKKVLYNVKVDIAQIPAFEPLQDKILFSQVQVDQSRTGIYWNDIIDLPSHALYEFGAEVKE